MAMSHHSQLSTKRPRSHPRPFSHPTFITCSFTSSTTITSSSTTPLLSPLRCSSFIPTTKTLRTTRLRIATPLSKTVVSQVGSGQLRENLTDVSETVLRAVESLSRQPRQTVADIAAAAGIPLSKATDEAVTLAALTNASIDVTESGDIAYRFPSDIRSTLRARSLRASLTMLWRRVSPTLYTVARVAFGALLIISIVVTFIAIAALSLAATSSSRDDDRRSSRSPFGFFGPRLFFGPNIFDVMFYSQRSNYYNRNSPRGGERRDDGQMSFLEAVYSLVFGDGDPNTEFDDNRWKSVAAVIRTNRGAVTADQLAPFLDPPLKQKSSSLVDESFILPALTRFSGHPEVTEDGDIIYVFPSFMTTGAKGSVEAVGVKSLSLLSPAAEQEEQLTKASTSQRALVITLGVINILGIAVLGAKLGIVIPVTRDAAQFIAFVKGIYPALCTYAASFVAAPLVRWWRMKEKNKEIRSRNFARAESSRTLQARSGDVTRKLRAAERFVVQGGKVSNDDVVYSSDRDILDQINLQDDLKDDFDRRLKS